MVVKKIIISGDKVRLYYSGTIPPDVKKMEDVGVLSIDTLGGPGGIRTPYLCDANAAFSRVNYGPGTTKL